MEYVISTANNIGVLCEIVARKIAQGWDPFGGPIGFCNPDYKEERWAQAFTRPQPETRPEITQTRPEAAAPICPKCKGEMTLWFADIGGSPTIPITIDIMGYGCQACQLTFIDLDRSQFDGFVHEHLFLSSPYGF